MERNFMLNSEIHRALMCDDSGEWIYNIRKTVEKWVMSILMGKAAPPIKYPVTKNKLRRRGITIRQINEGNDWTYEVWQRDKKLGALSLKSKTESNPYGITVDIKVVEDYEN